MCCWATEPEGLRWVWGDEMSVTPRSSRVGLQVWSGCRSSAVRVQNFSFAPKNEAAENSAMGGQVLIIMTLMILLVDVVVAML